MIDIYAIYVYPEFNAGAVEGRLATLRHCRDSARERIYRRPAGERALRRAHPTAFIHAKETKMTADSLQKQSKAPAGRLFQKGRSGNPGGRRPGCRNRVTQTAEVLLEGEAEALTRKAIELALEGDTTALR